MLLLDEPLSNLDAKLRISTRGEIRRLQKALSISTLYVTHDQEEAMAISDRIIVMNQGDIIQIGTAEELYYNPKTEFVAKFIGAINAIPSKIISSSDEEAVADIEGEKFKVRNFRKNVKPGDSADVLLRPEAVRLKEVNPESKIKGTVVERAFLGDRVDYTVAAESFTIKVSLYDSFGQVTFKCDQEVEIILDEKRMKILER